jgi:hypothetical protein
MKIISGGQTGADRAAIDTGIELGLPVGGWVPKGGWAEDYPNPPGLLANYPQLSEADEAAPQRRTRLNVRDSDATLILVKEGWKKTSPGTRLTLEYARELGRPVKVIGVEALDAAERVRQWLARLGPLSVLNVAGLRESEAPGLYEQAREILRKVL